MTELKDMLAGLAEDAQVYGAIERAERAGRRRRHRKRLARGGTAVLSVATVLIGVSLVPSTAPAPELGASPSAAPAPLPDQVIACTAKELPLPDGYPNQTYASGGDPTGRYIVGRSYAKDGRPRLVIWDGMQPTMVAMQGSDQQFNDITTSGAAIGSSFTGAAQEDHVSWIYQNGELKQLNGDNVEAIAVNEKLTIAGLESLGHATDGVIWHPDGTTEVLPIPAGYQPERVWPNEFRGDWIGGRMIEHSGRLVNLRWNRRTGEVTAFVDRTTTETVNALGWTAGFGRDMRLADGTAVALPKPDGSDGGGDIRLISDDGKTVGGTLLGDITHAVRWTCG